MNARMPAIIRSLINAHLLRLEADRVTVAYPWLQSYLTGEAVPAPDGPPLRATWGLKAVIGLTGNIAVGKSTVLDELAALGADVIDADRLVHRLREPGMPGYMAVIEQIGHDIVREDGRLDIGALSAMAFASPELMQKLEQIFRPLVVKAVAEWARESASAILVVEAIKLLEGDLRQAIDAVWVVDAPREEQIRRLVDARGLTPEDAQRRVDAQNPQAEKLSAADVVIHNAGSRDDMRWQVLSGWADMLERLVAAGWPIDGLLPLFADRCLAAGQGSISAMRAVQVLRQIAGLMPGEGWIGLDVLSRRLDIRAE